MGRALLDEPRSLQPGRGRPREGPRDAAIDEDVNKEKEESLWKKYSSGSGKRPSRRAGGPGGFYSLTSTFKTHTSNTSYSYYLYSHTQMEVAPLTSIVYSLQWLPAIIVIKRVFMVDRRPPPLPFQEPQEFYLR